MFNYLLKRNDRDILVALIEDFLAERSGIYFRQVK